ncbi:nucleoside 2-deoxyribosyltransferase [Lentzea sp. CA-135723]|uniref:nucleoside 2-deoxyribosyltransferase n=1 Tax=Lentzea sp. CA-135723 TaxID=3239950 RepID=UPI003D8B25AF
MVRSEGALAGVKVFIGGPIQHAILPDGFLERLEVALSTAIGSVQRAAGTVLSAHVAERFGADTPLFTPAQVAERDFGWMLECDVFVPVLPVLDDGDLLRTDGTHVELGWASALGKPIVGVTAQPFADSASHLLKGIGQVANARFVDIGEFTTSPDLLVETVVTALRERPMAASRAL